MSFIGFTIYLSKAVCPFSSEARQKSERERDVDEEIIALEGKPDISQTIDEIARKLEKPEKKLEEKKEEDVPKTRW